MVHRVTTSDNEWYNKWQQMTTNDNKWQQTCGSANKNKQEQVKKVSLGFKRKQKASLVHEGFCSIFNQFVTIIYSAI